MSDVDLPRRLEDYGAHFTKLALIRIGLAAGDLTVASELRSREQIARPPLRMVPEVRGHALLRAGRRVASGSPIARRGGILNCVDLDKWEAACAVELWRRSQWPTFSNRGRHRSGDGAVPLVSSLQPLWRSNPCWEAFDRSHGWRSFLGISRTAIHQSTLYNTMCGVYGSRHSGVAA